MTARKKKPAAKRGRGQPTKYTPELADKVLDYVAEGNPTYKIDDVDGLISKTTLFRWLAKYPEFRDKYARARETAVEANVAEIRQIRSDLRAGIIDHNTAKVEIWAIQWEASKLAPKKYGDRVQVDQTIKRDPLEDKSEDELRQMLAEAEGDKRTETRH